MERARKGNTLIRGGNTLLGWELEYYEGKEVSVFTWETAGSKSGGSRWEGNTIYLYFVFQGLLILVAFPEKSDGPAEVESRKFEWSSLDEKRRGSGWKKKNIGWMRVRSKVSGYGKRWLV